MRWPLARTVLLAGGTLLLTATLASAGGAGSADAPRVRGTSAETLLLLDELVARSLAAFYITIGEPSGTPGAETYETRTAVEIGQRVREELAAHPPAPGLHRASAELGGGDDPPDSISPATKR